MHARRYIAGLDGLRALAALAVFGVHFQQITGVTGQVGPFEVQTLLLNGNTGVCLFFVLSGFLLSLPFWFGRRPDGGEAGVGGLAAGSAAGAIGGEKRRPWLVMFAVKRVGRIMPAYYLCLTALVVFAAVRGDAHSLDDIAMHYAFVHNFTDDTLYSISDPFWTLAVQAQFYVLFPILLLLLLPVLRFRPMAMLVVAALIAGAFYLHWRVMHVPADAWPLPAEVVSPGGPAVRVSPLAHLPHFLLGILTAGAYAMTTLRPREQRGETNRPVTETSFGRGVLFDVLFFAAAVTVLVILGVPQLDAQLRLPTGAAEEAMIGRYNFPYVPLLIAVMILSAPRGPVAKRLLEWTPLRALGVISFGLYVYHLPCLELVEKLMGKTPDGRLVVVDRPAAFALTALALSIAVAAASYLLIERPILRITKRKRME